MSYKSFDLSKIELGVVVLILAYAVGNNIYEISSRDIGLNGCPKGQEAIRGNLDGNYVHLCVEPGATVIPVTLP